MKILVFSDSHRSLSGMYAAIDLHRPEQVIHLGDMMADAEEVAKHYPTTPFCLVPGNCDGWVVTVPVKKQITLGGKSILLSHGHRWGVKSGYERAIDDARAVGADVLLFGHTHRPLVDMRGKTLFLNPGSIGDYAHPFYGVLTLSGGRADGRTVPLD